MTSDPRTSLCDDIDHTTDMAEDKKRWLCVPRREKKYSKYKTTKINENALMLLFLFEINSMESIKRRFMFNFLVIAQKYILIFSLNRDFSQCFIA